MRSLVVAVLALVGVALADASALAQRRRGSGEPRVNQNGWLSSLQAGKQQARETGRPLMVVLRCVP